MRPIFPSLNVGDPVQRVGVAVFPVYVAQLQLFEKFDPKPPYAVAGSRQRKKVMACNRKMEGPRLASLTNPKEIPLLFLASDEITATSFLNCSVLVPGKTILPVPALCYGPPRPHLARGGPIFPPTGSIGWVAAGLYEWTLDLFSYPETCKMAGWQRRLTVCSSLGITPARQEVEAFAKLIHRLEYRRVKSITPWCSDWVASDRRGIRASALFYKNRLVHLHAIRTL